MLLLDRRRVAGLTANAARCRLAPAVLYLRELLSTIAHGDDNWGAAAMVRKVIAPFARG